MQKSANGLVLTASQEESLRKPVVAGLIETRKDRSTTIFLQGYRQSNGTFAVVPMNGQGKRHLGPIEPEKVIGIIQPSQILINGDMSGKGKNFWLIAI